MFNCRAIKNAPLMFKENEDNTALILAGRNNYCPNNVDKILFESLKGTALSMINENSDNDDVKFVN